MVYFIMLLLPVFNKTSESFFRHYDSCCAWKHLKDCNFKLKQYCKPISYYEVKKVSELSGFKLEAMAFSCFTELMKRMNQNFPHGGAMDTHFANMRSLIQVSPTITALIKHTFPLIF